jgi:hypothetical protein
VRSGLGPTRDLGRLPAVLLCLMAAACAAPHRPPAAPPATAQNPSPMVETTRRHDRLPDLRPDGIRLHVDAGLDRTVEVFVPGGLGPAISPRLLIHFHGAGHVAEQAVVARDRRFVLAVVNLGAGSSRYEEPFLDPARLPALVGAVLDGVAAEAGWRPDLTGVYLSAFSAGVGAVRAILGSPDGRAAVDGALLLDGLHTAYMPPRTVLGHGGRLETERLEGVLAYARDAVAGRGALAVTHSTVFPGTFASTTETADWLLSELGLARKAVLEWGPVGMQQLSEARAGRFSLLGFAGNSAPDHVDHLHALTALLDELR